MLGTTGMAEAKVLFWEQLSSENSQQKTAEYGTSSGLAERLAKIIVCNKLLVRLTFPLILLTELEIESSISRSSACI